MHNGNKHKAKNIWMVYLGISAVFFFSLFLCAQEYPNDDAIISYRYAYNLVNGYGLVSKPNAEKVEGFSNHLSVFVHAGVGKLLNLTDNIYHFTWLGRWLNIVFAWACVLALLWWQRKTNNRYWYLPALGLALFGPFYDFVMNGLETPLYLLMIILMLAFFSLGKRLVGTVFALLAALNRPESIGLAGLVMLYVTYQSWREGKLKKEWLWFLLIFAAPLIAFHAWRFWYFGNLLPNTVIAKNNTVPYRARLFLAIKYMLGALNNTGFFVLTALTLFRFAKKRASVVYEIIICGFQLVFIIGTGGDFLHFGYYRFLAPVIPSIFISLSELASLFEKLLSRFKKRLSPSFAIVLSVLTIHFSVFYHVGDKLWYAGVLHPYYSLFSGKPPPNLRLQWLMMPKISINNLAIEYLVSKISHQSLSLTFDQAGGAHWIWPGKVMDQAGLVSKEYATDRTPESVDKIFLQNQTDLVALYGEWALGLEKDHALFSESPTFKTLLQAGYQPIGKIVYYYPDVDWFGKIYRDHFCGYILVFAKDSNLVDFSEIETMDYLSFSYNGKTITYSVPVKIFRTYVL